MSIFKPIPSDKHETEFKKFFRNVLLRISSNDADIKDHNGVYMVQSAKNADGWSYRQYYSTKHTTIIICHGDNKQFAMSCYSMPPPVCPVEPPIKSFFKYLGQILTTTEPNYDLLLGPHDFTTKKEGLRYKNTQYGNMDSVYGDIEISRANAGFQIIQISYHGTKIYH